MNKKIKIGLCVLLLMLVACSSTEKNGYVNVVIDDQKVTYEISDEMSIEEKYDVISNECIGFIQVDINPSFELYLVAKEGQGYVVVGARALNEDAQKVLKNVQVANITLWDALFIICDETRDKGMLSSKSTIDIKYYGDMDAHNPSEVVSDAMQAYQKERNITFNYDTVSTALESSNSDENDTSKNEHIQIDEELYDVVEKDVNGNIVKTVYKNVEDNCIETRTYSENGEVLSLIFEDINFGQTHEEYYDNGIVVKRVSILTDMVLTQTFDNLGNMMSEVIDDKESGSYSEVYWTYYANGNKASYCIDLKDSYYTKGYHKEETYSQGGALTMSYEVSQYGDNKYFYDGSGNVTRYEGKNNKGERVETTYNADGTYVSKIHESNGKVRTETLGKDGNLVVSY